MRRINRGSSNGFYSRGRTTELNIGGPEIFMNPLWTDDEVRRSVLEDIQQSFALDLSPEDTTQLNGRHVYNGEENDHYNNGMTNWKSRERRRMKKDAENRYTTKNTSANTDYSGDNVCTELCGASSINDNVTINHQMNCFTIINKHYAMNSETSSENEIEIIDCNNVPDASEWNGNANHGDIEEIVNHEPDLDNEKRTVWIYSYRNRQDLLDEAVEEYMDIPIPSMSNSSTDADEEVTLRDKEPNRVSSPVPSNFIPRLNLTGPSLSTVAEVTENGSSSRDMLTKKQANSWFGEHETTEVKSVNTEPKLVQDKSTNFDSVTLSARERRRQKMEQIIMKSDSDTQTVNEDLVIHGCKINIINQRSVSSQANMNIELLKTDRKQQINYVPETIRTNVFTEKPKLTSSVLVSTEDIANDSCSTPIKDTSYKKPYIQKKLPIASFPGSVDALHCNDWIRENKVYEGRERVETSRTDASHRLLVRNAFLLRPAPWAEFGPVADSVPSLQISLGGTDFDGEKIAWWRRALRCMLCR